MPRPSEVRNPDPPAHRTTYDMDLPARVVDAIRCEVALQMLEKTFSELSQQWLVVPDDVKAEFTRRYGSQVREFSLLVLG